MTIRYLARVQDIDGFHYLISHLASDSDHTILQLATDFYEVTMIKVIRRGD